MCSSVSRSEEWTMLQKRSSELTSVFTPVIIFVSVLMVLGLFGNSMLLYFYGLKHKKTPNIYFILFLALFDLLTCVLGMPMEIVELVRNITFKNVVACKILRFVTYFTNIASALILTSIAVDRYRRICKPFKNQFSIKQVQIMCGLCAAASVLLSWPASVFFMIEPSYVIYTDPKNTTHLSNITGCDCTLTRQELYRPYVLAFHVVHLIGFVALTISLAVMYGRIASLLYYNRKQRLDSSAFNQKCTRSYESPPKRSHTSSMTTDEKVDTNDDIVTVFIARSNEKCNPASNETSSLQDLPSSEAILRENKITLKIIRDTPGNQSNCFRTGMRDNSVVKQSVMMFIVALVFVLSFLPYIGVAIKGIFMEGNEYNLYTDGQLVALELGYRSYFINNAINPFIYGFFNSKFRYYVYRKICPCCFSTGGGSCLK